MEKWQSIINELKAINDDLAAFIDRPMAIDRLKETYTGCIYCGEEKGEKLSCCGENHFDELEDE